MILNSIIKFNIIVILMGISHTLQYYLLQNLVIGSDIYTIGIGYLLYLPIGFALVSFLIFRYFAILPILLVSVFFNTQIYGSNYPITFLFPIIDAFGPLLAISLLEKMDLASFKNFPLTSKGHLFFLAIITAIINTSLKYSVYFFDASLRYQWIDNGPANFLLTFITGDLVGATIIVMVGYLLCNIKNSFCLRT
jgi:hypothetical protein